MTEVTSDEDHSLRATTATRGLTKGVPEKFVMERTEHRDGVIAEVRKLSISQISKRRWLYQSLCESV